MRDLLKTNCFDIQETMIVMGSCLEKMQPRAYEVKHNYIDKLTSGKFKIIYINKPEEMEMAHNLIDRNKDTFFKLPEC